MERESSWTSQCRLREPDVHRKPGERSMDSSSIAVPCCLDEHIQACRCQTCVGPWFYERCEGVDARSDADISTPEIGDISNSAGQKCRLKRKVLNAAKRWVFLKYAKCSFSSGRARNRVSAICQEVECVVRAIPTQVSSTAVAKVLTL